MDLSGGGVRAAFAGIGALYWLRTARPKEEITEIVSVSGGTLVNATILSRQPGNDSWIEELISLFDRLRLGPRAAASLVGIGGSYALVALGAFGTRRMLDEQWATLGLFFGLWIFSLAVARIIVRPLILLALVVGLIGVTIPTNIQNILANGAIVTIISFAGFTFVYTKEPRSIYVKYGRISLSVFISVTFTMGALGLKFLGPAFGTWWTSSPKWLTSAITGVALSYIVGALLVPAFFRSYATWACGATRRLTLGACAVSMKNISSRRRHVICVTDLREEAPAFLTISGDGGASLDLERARGGRVTQDFAKTKIGSMVHAAISSTSPVSNGSPWLWVHLPLLVDGGLHGTLGTQYRPTANNVSTSKHVVVDATRHPRPVRWWPLIRLPQVGPSLMKLKFLQISLGRLVALERLAVRRSEAEIYFAPATGAMQEVTSTSVVAKELGKALRRHADKRWFWFMGSRNAARCVASGALATLVAIKGNEVTDSEVNELMRAIERDLSVDLRLKHLKRAGLLPRVRQATDRISRSSRAAVSTIGISTVFRYALVAAPLWLVVGPVFARDLCGPVCRDRNERGTRHAFWQPLPADTPDDDWPLPLFLAISHEGVRQNGEPVTLQGFRDAQSLGFRYMETDIVLTTDGRLVAHHLPPTEGAFGADGLVDATGITTEPTMSELLNDKQMAEVRWNLELSLLMDGDNLKTFTDEFLGQLGRHSARVCVHWGRTINADKVKAFREQLPTGMCNCATAMEREQNSRLPPLRLLASAWNGSSRDAGPVDCTVVNDTVATSVRPAGQGVPVLTWPASENETHESLRQLIRAPFIQGIITNEPEKLKDILHEQGLWPWCFAQPVNANLLDYECPADWNREQSSQLVQAPDNTQQEAPRAPRRGNGTLVAVIGVCPGVRTLRLRRPAIRADQWSAMASRIRKSHNRDQRGASSGQRRWGACSRAMSSSATFR